MKYLIIGLNFLFENPQAPNPLENTVPPCDWGLPQENKKVPAPLFLRMLQNFWASPAEKGGGGEDTMATLTKGGFL